MSQISFETSDFANNPEPRCPCVLLLDISHSMSGQPIEELNNGLYFFKQALAEDALALKRVELAIVTFGPTRLELPFTSAAHFMPAELCTRGDTPIGNAVTLAIELVQQRKTSYKNNGIPYYRPWIFLITDGEPTDAWEKAAELIKEGEASKAFAFFAVGVGGANMETLAELSVREPIALDGLKFKELFTWLSASLSSVSQSTPGTEVSLPSPKGWASV